MNLKKLDKIKTGISFLQFISVFVLMFLIVLIYAFSRYVYYSDSYKKENLIVYRLDIGITVSGPGANWFDAYGSTETGKNKVYNVVDKTMQKNIHVGDTVPVWSSKYRRDVILRKDNEENFPKKRYYLYILNTVIFGIFPIILIWLYKIKINKQIYIDDKTD
jgi:hypothetical protein